MLTAFVFYNMCVYNCIENKKDISDIQAEVNNVLLAEDRKQYKAGIFKPIQAHICGAIKHCVWT